MADFRPSHGTVRFGAFELDQDAGELRKEGIKVRLQDQPLQILQILLEQPGKVTAREELRQRIWPVDTFVDFDHGLYNAIRRLREALGDSAETPHFIETVPRRGYRFIGNLGTTLGRIKSLAVLPLENLSRDPEQEYFAEGLTEALITILAKIGELRVVPRTSAMQYKGVRKPVREIARELDVDTVVEGTVLRVGDRVRITAQLIDAPNEAHLWAESYNRELRDILGLQSELAQAIAREIRIKLTPKEKAHFQKVHPVDPEAYENYLRGRYYFNKRGGDMLQKGTQAFQQAITRDPTYVAAYAGLADCLSMFGWFAFVSPEEGCGRAKRLALRALEMDPSLAEAHTSLAWAIQHYDYDLLGAEKEFRRCIELDPLYEPAHYWLAIDLAAMGRFEEAIAEAKHAIGLDPLSRAANTNLGYVYWCARRYDLLIEQSKKTLELHPNLAHLHWALGFGYLETSQYEAAIAELGAAVEHSHGAPIFLALLGETYAIAGHRGEARRSLNELQALAKQRYITPYMLGRIHAALNEKDEALNCFEIAYHGRAAWTVYLKIDPHLDNLRPDPRFQDLLRGMNFPP